MNNLSELATKRSCVEALPGAVRYLHLTCASQVSCERVDRADDSTFRHSDSFESLNDEANSIWNRALVPSPAERLSAKLNTAIIASQ